jgi:Fur family ferric uptake transcriptional regulator
MERSTRQRTAIRAAIDGADRPLSPQEVLAAARAEVPGLSLATVYRNLKGLQDAAEISVVSLPGDSPRFESIRHGHHHHFQCTACARVFDVHACPGDLSKLAPQGFAVDHHELTLYGRCAACLARRRPPVAAPPRPPLPGAVISMATPRRR